MNLTHDDSDDRTVVMFVCKLSYLIISNHPTLRGVPFLCFSSLNFSTKARCTETVGMNDYYPMFNNHLFQKLSCICGLIV